MTEPAATSDRLPRPEPMPAKIPWARRLDPFIVGILLMVLVASVLPAQGRALAGFNHAVKIAIALLFFLYGARLSPLESFHGLRHWRLHATVLASTFVLFPLLGWAARGLVPSILPEPLYRGIFYLCLLPSTVQSSIAFTSIARGNVAAAIVSASFSNLVGVLATPLLVEALIASQGAKFDPSSIRDIALMLLAPFLLGQLMRPLIGAWVRRHGYSLKFFDRGSILLVVYAAFSQGMNEGIWRTLTLDALLALTVVSTVLLGIVLAVTWFGSHWLGFNRADQIAITFCGSKKSLATGLPMATVLFAGQPIGLIVLPLMLFHQIQLVACAWIAGRLARTAEGAAAPPAPVATKPTR